MSVLYAGRTCIDPQLLRQSCAERTPPVSTDSWWGKVNLFRRPLGRREHGAGQILLTQDDLDSIDLDAWRDLTFRSAEHSVTLQKITLTRAVAVSPGREGDATNVYLCDLVDRRYHLARVPIDRGYNIRNQCGTGWLSETLHGELPWTWQEIIDDLFATLGIGDAPELDPVPDGTPENLAYYGAWAWHALHDVLDRLAWTAEYDPSEDEFTLVQLGEVDRGDSLDSLQSSRVWDAYARDPAHAWAPETIRVAFVRRPIPQSGTSPFYMVDLPSGQDGARAGTFLQLMDDMSAVGVFMTPDNAGDLATRAAERVADWLRKRSNFETYFQQTYYGHRESVPGGSVGDIAWRDCGVETGQLTDVRAQPDGRLEGWKPLQNWLPPWMAGTGADCTTTTTTDSPSTTTTTTAAPCAGGYAEWSFGEDGWELSSSTCTEPCFAAAPVWCPEASDLEGSCLTTRTRCGHYAADQTPLYCNPEGGTSGEPTRPPECTTTTTLPPNCNGECKFYCVPGRGWVRIDNPCSDVCPCPYPNVPCIDACEGAKTGCVVAPPPPPPYCTGKAIWLCIYGVEGVANHWEWLNGYCDSFGVPNCYYDRPDDTKCDACAKITETYCYVHHVPGDPTESPGCPPYIPTTTASPPGSCSGTCLQRSDGEGGWEAVRSCLGCECQAPDRLSESDCDTEITPCTPTTTTARPCLGTYQSYYWTGTGWAIAGTSVCQGAAGCEFDFCIPDALNITPPDPTTIGEMGYAPCYCPGGETTTVEPTTTTTAEPTTTTTSTTTTTTTTTAEPTTTTSTTTESPCPGGTVLNTSSYTANSELVWIPTGNACEVGFSVPATDDPDFVSQCGTPTEAGQICQCVPCKADPTTTTTPAPPEPCEQYSADTGMYGIVFLVPPPTPDGSYSGLDDFAGLWTFVNDGADTWTLTSPYSGEVAAIGWNGVGCQDFSGILVCCQDA